MGWGWVGGGLGHIGIIRHVHKQLELVTIVGVHVAPRGHRTGPLERQLEAAAPERRSRDAGLGRGEERGF